MRHAALFCAVLGPVVAAVGSRPAQTSSTTNLLRDTLKPMDPLPTNSARQDRYVAPSGSNYNDGTQAHPWATLSHAGALASPGMVVHVAPGRYIEPVATSANGTAAARITYISDQAWAAVIDAPARDGFAWKNTGNYTDIVGFEVTGSRCGGIGLGGSFQRAIYNHVHNSAAGCDTSDGGSGINDFNYTEQGNEILSNYVHDVGIHEPSCGQRWHNYIQGIYQANAGGRIDHNVTANNCGWGIHLWHAATHATITNNTVVGNRAGGIVIGSGDAPCSTSGCPGGNDFTHVINNILAFNGNSTSGGWGLGETSQAPGYNGAHNEYRFNLSFQNASGDFYLAPARRCDQCIAGKDPLFISISSGDYRLRASSPAVQAGEVIDSAASKPVNIGALPAAQ